MKLKLLNIFFLVVLSFSVLPAYSQITIGYDNTPLQAAILDIKEKDADLDNETAEGGVMMPRVSLTSLNSLEPLLSSTLAADSEQKLLHTGLIVYNMNDTPASLEKGIYYWDGAEWRLLLAREVTPTGPWNKIGTFTPSTLNTDNSYLRAKAVINDKVIRDGATLTVSGGDASINGLTVGRGKKSLPGNIAIGEKTLQNANDSKFNTAIGYNTLAALTTGDYNTVVGSGALNALPAAGYNIAIGKDIGFPSAVNSNYINIGNALFGIRGAKIENARVGIGTATPGATLHVDKSMRLTSPASITGMVLVVASDGTVGIRETTPIPYVYVQNTQLLSVPTNGIENAVEVTWGASDIYSNNNNLIELQSSSIFRIKKAFAAEISGYINYSTGAAYPSSFAYGRDNASALLNLRIQISQNNGSTWTDVSNTRGIWTYGELGTLPQTIETPVVIQQFNEGDLIKMVIQRPYYNNSYIGISHGSTAAIMRPTNLPYSRGIRIVGL